MLPKMQKFGKTYGDLNANISLDPKSWAFWANTWSCDKWNADSKPPIILMVVSNKLTSLLFSNDRLLATQSLASANSKRVRRIMLYLILTSCESTKLMPTALKIHDIHCIQRIDDGQTKTKPIRASFWYRSQMVSSPRVLLVPFPRVQKCVNHGLLPGILGA